MKIHPTAVVDPKAEIHETVSIGPYTVIGPGVKIGADSEIGAHCALSGPTVIGEENRIGPFATVGAPPQDIKYRGEPTELVIGNRNIIREYASLHRGTVAGLGYSRIGDDNLLMAYVHVAHDCVIGNGVIMANAVTLAGHVLIEDRSIIGGLTAIQQFVRVGTFTYIGGMSGLSKDVPPYVVMAGVRKQMRIGGINQIGMRRAGFAPENIKKLQAAYKIIFRTPDLLLQEALERALEAGENYPEVRHLVDFFRNSKQGVLRQVDGSDD
ncbi:acyl-ACP--UDP-N-acetylglucosamine O-acyltransferase [Desulfurivibrio alkaliphilus]|uniref:Acyl-[acyl-carrier-protein]--UDP-N-acetylglucosamine O-acyltransferase n=1 Tax=Desulfurivibrio alkaliphilus (strain DSM 19089 / UNIQEM U267 / AHT2) TaxID=589865 RepID=D6Z1Y8_DESAT|nr:acyl-ACP--UDP-N-acetylglucosamine O-acyltransferase [Desulfurivibrio alkaliphilus]ADH85563.1 acyl-(acyl-carrier-protein)--UDP-N-acetylglucosamine O-acyltransferase [Desulfurivibrio alkaliphilus AHT 2]